MNPVILHVIQALSLGGAARALIATAKASARLGPYRHRVISLLRPAPDALRLAEEAGLAVVVAPDPATLRQELATADIVQLHWWNNPQNQQFLRGDWPATRLAIWYHIAGEHAPQRITRELVEFADLNIPTNPWTHRELPVFGELPPPERDRRVAMVLDAADLDRVAGATLRPHAGFNVGYIGAVDFIKMHRNFVPMSAAVKIPDARFIVCGTGIEQQLHAQAQALGAGGRFDFRGYVHDIRPVIETFDVYGYPLCADSYASGELNLQEVMAVGVPPVVFPAGGIRGLVEHEKTGLVVATEAEYAAAIEHLHQHPEERRRLGLAAQEHARAHFGAEPAARLLNPLYERLLREPKRPRKWGVPVHGRVADEPVSVFDVLESPAGSAGARLFVESLGDAGVDYGISLASTDVDALLAAEARIAGASELVKSNGAGGFRQYRRNFPKDPHLQLWHALALTGEAQWADAAVEFGRAIDAGCAHWRIGWYIAQAARRAGNESLAIEAAQSVLAVEPAFQPARDFLRPASAAAEPVRPVPAPVNEAFLASQREFWNVATLDEAMFGRVFTSAEITRMSPSERQTAWTQSAAASAAQVLSGVPHQPEWRVLEIGCGVGRVIKPLRERFARVDGVDISEKMIAYAQDYLAGTGCGEVTVNTGADLAGLPSAAYDLVYSIIVFQHIRSVSVVRNYLRETWRVLKPGGYFRLQVYERSGRQGQFDEEAQAGVQYGFNGNGYAPDELRALLEEGGFTVAGLETAGRWIWATAVRGAVPIATGAVRETPAPSAPNAPAVANPSTATPLISAILSTYNSERFLRGCLEDLERQTVAGQMEILVIDSGSQQNERAIVEEFQQRYANIRYVRTEREPLYVAWNRGVRLARGKYITNANADDRHEPHGLERHIQALEANPDAVLAYADVAFCEEVHPDSGAPRFRGCYRWPDFDGPLLFANCYIGPQPVWRRDVHERHGYFDESYKSAGDYEFWLRLAVHERFIHIPEVLGLYWYSPKSVGHDNMDLTRAEADRARRAHWQGAWGTWPKLTRALLQPFEPARPVQPTSVQDLSSAQPARRRARAPKPAPPARSPFELDFSQDQMTSSDAGTGSRAAVAPPAPPRSPSSPRFDVGPEPIPAPRHVARILSSVPAGGRALIWGARPILEALEPALRARAGEQGECVLWDQPGTPATNGPFDVIVMDGARSGAGLAQAARWLAPGGVAFLWSAPDPEHDAAKRALVEYGHLGPCVEAPGLHLWWGGIAPFPVAPVGREPSPAMRPIVINFFTANTPYEEEAKRLVASCRALGLECHSEPLPTRGDWVANCGCKPRFVLEAWRKLRRPVLWLDADAIVRARPALLDGAGCDFAVHKIDGWQFASGTIFFNQTPLAEQLLERWVEISAAQPGLWDQVTLDQAWEDLVLNAPLETLWLPDTYTKIFDRPSHFPADAVVIEHFQASRRLKKVVSENQADIRPKYAPDLVAARRASRPLRTRLPAPPAPPASCAATSAQPAASPGGQPRTTEDVLESMRGRRIAIVGNATPSEKFGATIDAYDVVIRLNNYRLEGFAELVGRRTTHRCTSGWRDIEHRDGPLEFSPFAESLPESANVAAYNAARAQAGRPPLLTPRTDIHALLPAVAKPSTGAALAALCARLGLNVDLFAFDGFQTPHYWAPGQAVRTTHNGNELTHVLRLPGVCLHSTLMHSSTPDSAGSPRASSSLSSSPADLFCLPAGYRARSQPQYYEDSVTHATGIVWQPDVYPIVARLARRLQAFHVLDLGCGRGDKLAGLHPEFMLTGVDYGANLQHCRSRYAFGQWLEADFESVTDLPVPAQVLARTVVVCSDVIEHLVNPTALLQLLARLLEQVPLVVLSTPDRDRARGPGDMGPPKNKAHVREWTLPELEALLQRHGLPVEFIGFTRSNTQTGACQTQIAILRGKNTPPRTLLPGLQCGDAIGIVEDRIDVLPPEAAGTEATPRPEPAPAIASGRVADTSGSSREIAGDPATDLDGIERQAREALRLNPGGIEAKRLLVTVGLQRGRWAETARLCREILQQNPADVPTLLALAKCFFKAGDRETTRLVLARALEFEPNNALARENLGTLAGAGESAQATARPGADPAESSAAAPSSPSSQPTQPAQALAECLQRARCALAARDLDGARTALEQAVRWQPRDADLWASLGNIQAEAGDRNAARASYARALAVDANHPEASARIVEMTIDAPASEPAASISPTTAATTATPGAVAGDKEAHELAYWRKCQAKEGTLANGHYRAFYTDHFGLPYEFYAGKRILDIGCGPRGSLEWADNASERIGLDPLADRYRELGTAAHRMRYVASGSETIPFPDGYFDVVTSFNSLDHVENLERTLREITRVVKPGGSLLLLTDVNHSPTPCEPIEFGWDIVERFKADFEVESERHFEKIPKAGLYRSVEEGVTYDHTNPARRYGILSVKLRRRPVPAPTSSAPVAIADPGAVSRAPGSNRADAQPQAFAQLQRGFDLLKERRFAEAQAACASYQRLVSYDTLPRDDRRPAGSPGVSVVIVAYRIGRGLIACLDSLAESARTAPVAHEIIVVDNGGNEDIADELARRELLHVRMPMNVILSEGRNVGVHFARAPIVAFVDDDAIVEPGYLAGVRDAFAQFDVDGYRGRVLPKSDHPNNRFARHYDMGERAFPADVDTEGNSAFRTEVYREFGGMDPLLFGMEGTELSYRIALRRGGYRTMYWPHAIIRHDYAGTDDKLGQKNARHQLMRDYAAFKHPGLQRHHRELVTFNQTDSTRETGHRLLRRHAAAARNPAASSAANAGPFITICVPTYNRARFIEETLESIFRQTYSHYEVVVVDDGSTDSTAEIMRRWARPNLRYIRKEHSGGPATRNRCIAEARGEFLVWVDSDDVILPGTLATYVEALAQRPEVDVLYGDLRVVNDQTVGDFISVYRDYFGWPEALPGDLMLENRIPNVCTLVRKSCYERFGGYDEAFPRAHDYQFWARLAAGGVVHRVHSVVGLYRQHGQSLSQHQGRTDTSYEARVVRQLVDRFGLRRLFPHCYGPAHAPAPSAAGDARAAFLVALVLLKYENVSATREFLERSAQAAAVPEAQRLLRLIDGLHGSSPAHGHGSKISQGGGQANGHVDARGQAKSKSKSNDKARARSGVTALVESALTAFRAGDARACAAACARLTELHPEEMETLVLVGASLFRWGDRRAAVAAHVCAFNRQSEQMGLAAVAQARGECERESDSELTSPGAVARAKSSDAAASSALPPTLTAEGLSGLAATLAREFPGITLSTTAVRRTVEDVLATAAATRTSASLRRLAERRTALFEAFIRLGDDELDRRGGRELVAAARAVRKSLSTAASVADPTAASASSARTPGYSFCIITNGKRPEKLRRQIESIRALNVPGSEILVGGDIPRGFEDVTAVRLEAAARDGRLGAMRNALARRARHDHLILSDDDFVFAPDFLRGLQQFGEDYEVMAVAIRNPDGTRFWDWATAGGLRGQVLLDPDEVDLDVYVTGGFCVLKAAVLDRVCWDPNLGFYQGEDVDFSRRLHGAGLGLAFNPFCRVTHDDDRYTQVGRKVMRLDHLLNGAAERHAAGDRAAAHTYLAAAARLSRAHPGRWSELRALVSRLGEQTWFATVEIQPEAAVPPRAADGAPTTRLAWDGTFLDLGSLSHVNRELTEALRRQGGLELARCAPAVDPQSVPPFPAIQSLAATLNAPLSGPAHVTVRHAWPPDFRRPRAGAWVLIQPWEFGALPADWIRELARVDEVWVPSRYTRQVYIDSGVDPAKVQVVPNGFKPGRFHPEARPLPLPSRKTFKFLFVGGTIRRKGPDLLLQAYLDRFTAADDVCLVIKDFGGQGVYAGQTFSQQIAAAKARPHAPEIVYLTDDLSPDQMAGLYTACDCLVHPYRGEGFGLPVLEAMACGRPVIVTAGGATDDFVTEDCGWRVPSVRRQFGDSVNGMKLVKPGWFLEPDPTALAERMAWAAAHPDETRTKGFSAARHALAGWTWDHAAAIARRRLQTLALATHPAASQSSTPAPASTTAPRTKALELPRCALVGHLGEARALFERKSWLPAWQAALEALRRRPFHPEAWLTLAEIAHATGDSKQAKTLAERARVLAPKWKPAQKLAKNLGRNKGAGNRAVAPAPALAVPEELRAASGPGRLSVCLIVRNEEQFLDRCLESVRGLAAQIVVVDTGSTDGTVAIARRHGAEISEFAWNDDFSAARNAALERATGDWVLFLDADEELVAADHDKLRKLMSNPAVIGYRLPMIDQGREDEGVNYVPRLYRNAPGLFYVGRVHEQVYSSLEVRREEWGLENQLGDATLLHHGYTKDVVASRDKIARNLRLLEQAVVELPGEPNLLMNLGLELTRAGRATEGLERYQEAFERMSALPRDQMSPELREALLAQYGNHLFNAKHYAEVARLYQSPLAQAHGLTASMHWVLGLACIESKLYSEGADQMRQCLAKRGRRALTLVHRGILKAGPHHCLALCLAAMKRHDEAGRAFAAALKEDPSARSVRFDFARHLASVGQEVEALKWIHQLMAEDPADVRVWRLGGIAALQKPDFIEFALDWTGEAVRTHPNHDVLLEQRALALLLADRPAEAHPLWTRLTEAPASLGSTPASAWAARLACAAAEDGSTGQRPPAGASAAGIDAEFLGLYRRLLRWHAAKTVAGINRSLDWLRPVIPNTAQMLDAALAEANAR